MFVGQYNHSMDAKGRVALPAKFRTELKKAVVTKGLDNCLFVYPKKEWDKMAEKLAALPVAKANTRAFSRLMLAGAMEVEFDKQGRIILPEYLREFAGLKKNVIVAGLYTRLEIWDHEAWSKYQKEMEKNSNEIAENLNELSV
jgi:MraZ protein